MKRVFITVCACLCLSLASSGALALDWSLNSTLSERVELNDNPFLRSMLAGGTLSSYSTISANATARTPTSRFVFDGDIAYQKYFGPGIEGTPSESLGGGARGHYETTEKNGGRNYLDAGWRRQSTAFALLGDVGLITNARGFVDTTTIGGGLERSLSALDTIAVSARSTFTSFDPPTQGTPLTDTVVNGTWRRRLNSLALLTATSEIERLSFDNAQKTNVTILRDNLGLDATLSPRLSFHGTAGVAYIQVQGGGSSLILPTGTAAAPTASSGSVAGFVGDAALTYKMLQDTTLTLSALQSISPTVVGSLSQLTTIRAGLTRTVNSRSTLSFAADASRQTFSGSTTNFLSASIVYSYMLTRDWSAQLSYRYLHRLASSGPTTAPSLIFNPLTGIPIISGTGPASSNSIMVVVSRNVSILPDGY